MNNDSLEVQDQTKKKTRKGPTCRFNSVLCCNIFLKEHTKDKSGCVELKQRGKKNCVEL